MNRPISILLISAAPDQRESSRELDLLSVAAERRSDVELHRWYLRHSVPAVPVGDDVVIDDLRRWWVSQVAVTCGQPRLAHALQGMRLRAWYRRVAPDVVVLDDGLGERVIPGSAAPTLVVRSNAEAPDDRYGEALPARRVALTVPGGPATDGVRSSSSIARRYRERYGLRARSRVVTGWGPLGWADAPDVFVRALWHVKRLGVDDLEGVWFSASFDRELRARLEDEVKRCGLVGSVQFVDEQHPADWHGDAVFLPHREPVIEADVHESLSLAIRPTVFHAPASVIRYARPVPYLDLAAVAVSITEQFAANDGAALFGDDRFVDAATWLDAMVELAVGRG